MYPATSCISAGLGGVSAAAAETMAARPTRTGKWTMLDTDSLRISFALVALTLLVLFLAITYRIGRSAYAAWWCASHYAGDQHDPN